MTFEEWMNKTYPGAWKYNDYGWSGMELAYEAGYEAGRAEQVVTVLKEGDRVHGYITDNPKEFETPLTRKELAVLIDSYLFRNYNMNEPTEFQILLRGLGVFLMDDSNK